MQRWINFLYPCLKAVKCQLKWNTTIPAATFSFKFSLFFHFFIFQNSFHPFLLLLFTNFCTFHNFVVQVKKAIEIWDFKLRGTKINLKSWRNISDVAKEIKSVSATTNRLAIFCIDMPKFPLRTTCYSRCYVIVSGMMSEILPIQ